MSAPVQIQDALETLAACLAAQMMADGSPTPCFVGVLPGAAVAVDLTNCDDDPSNDGDCGMAYVRMVTMYPATEVGIVNLVPGNCGNGQGLDAEIGIFRCFPLNADGSAPEPDVLLDASRQQIKDAVTMRTVLNCCDWLDDQRAFVVGQYVPVGPQGGIVGGTFPVSAWLP